MVECHPISVRDQSRLLRIDRGRNLERRHSGCGYEEPEMIDASEIYPRRINSKEVLITQKGEEFKFPSWRYSKSVGKRLPIPRTTPRREQTARSEDLSGELQGEPEEPQPTELKDDAEARKELLGDTR